MKDFDLQKILEEMEPHVIHICNYFTEQKLSAKMGELTLMYVVAMGIVQRAIELELPIGNELKQNVNILAQATMLIYKIEKGEMK